MEYNNSSGEKKIIITENTDLNNVQMLRAAVEAIDNDNKPPMHRTVQEEPVLKMLLDKINIPDFKNIASKGAVTLLRQKIDQTRDQTEKERLGKEIEKFEPDEDSKLVILMENLLKVADENDTGLVMNNSMPYFYNGTHWKSLEVELLLGFLENVAEKSGIQWLRARQPKFKDKLLKQFNSTAAFKEPRIKNDDIKINLLNGTYYFNNNGGELGELRNAKKEDFLKYIVPFNYLPGAQAPLFIKYLNQVLPDVDAQKVLLEFIAYIFTFGMKLEKTLFLYGSGANGKSVFFEIITALLGEENVSHFSMDRLLDSTGYFRAKIENKLLNYSSELDSIKDPQLFKKLTSGEPVDARLPYGQPFIITNYGKFIFNTNELPPAEQTEAYHRRGIFIPFEQTIPVAERDIKLAKKIIESELSGIFNIVLEALERLVKQGGLTQSALIDNQLLTYRRESNTVEQFLENEEWRPSIENKVSVKDFYPQYFQYCKSMGHSPVNSQKFTARLRNLNYRVERSTKGYYYVWCEKKSDSGYIQTTIIDDDFLDALIFKSPTNSRS